MKICYFADAQNIHTQRWVKYFVERGHEIHLISFKKAEIENICFHYIGPLIRVSHFSILFLLFLKFIKIKKIIKEINPDIIHGHYLLEHGFYAATSGFNPLIVSAWGSDVLVSPKKSFISRFILKYTIRKADMIHSVSNQLTNELISYGVDKGRILNSPIGVDTERFNPDVCCSETRESLGWKDNPIVLSIRNFERIYNIECLINAIPFVVKEIPDAKFMLIGKGSLENRLKNMVKESGISNSAKFIDYVQYDELPSYFGCADIYVSTSLSDGTSISLLEAMAYGLPVVVTNITGNKSWIKNNKNGYLFEKKDSEALAKHLINLIKDREKSKSFGEINRKIVKEKGDHNKNMEKIERVYKNLINAYQVK